VANAATESRRRDASLIVRMSSLSAGIPGRSAGSRADDDPTFDGRPRVVESRPVKLHGHGDRLLPRTPAHK
jgi:hypothetical protein